MINTLTCLAIAVSTTGVVDYAKNCSGKTGIDETSFAQTYAKWN
jgi:hypothetical protein